MIVRELAELLRGRRWSVLTGAGISTDSGIPDYRGAGSRPASPIQYADFLRADDVRRRYWARSLLGFRSFGAARPNAGHRALATLAGDRGLTTVITQNVDGLHLAGGSPSVVDLHGRIDRVVCLGCGVSSPRTGLQRRLEEANPGLEGQEAAGRAELDDRLRPDGDAVVERWGNFVVLPCERCGGLLKPDVVFFGESVPAARVAQSYAIVDEAEVLVVAGSSLTVMSGLRFVRHAARSGKPVAIVNRGATRGDELATVRIDAGTSEVLTALAVAL